MPSFRDKISDARLYSVTVAADDSVVIIPLSGASVGNTWSSSANLAAGPKMWDNFFGFIGVTASGGSYQVTLWGNVNGMSYQLADAFIGRDNVASPATVSNIPFVNRTNTPYIPAPTHIFIDETAAGNLSGEVRFIGKAYRGFYPGRANSGDRAVEGRLLGSTAYQGGTNPTFFNIALADNPAAASGGAAGARTAGTGKVRVWDKFCAYANVSGQSGASQQLFLIGTVGGLASSTSGTTIEIARTPVFSGVTKVAFQMTGGAAINPTHVIYKAVGVSANATFQIDFMAKAGRGQRIGGR